jgi:hypothetical protein
MVDVEVVYIWMSDLLAADGLKCCRSLHGSGVRSGSMGVEESVRVEEMEK